MPTLARNVLAVLAGLLAGGALNGALIMLSPSLIPPPAGVDVNSAENLAESIHLFQPRHFVMPFLAHALGTMAGALVAYIVAASNRAGFAWALGVAFLAGGISASYMIPAPIWFIVLDLLMAYLPMAWLAIQIGKRMQPARTPSAVPG